MRDADSLKLQAKFAVCRRAHDLAASMLSPKPDKKILWCRHLATLEIHAHRSYKGRVA
jgi:hypothetical protein